MIKDIFPSYSFSFFSEHDILSIENVNDGLKFVFSSYRNQFIIDVYYKLNCILENKLEENDEMNFFWSEPRCFTFYFDSFTFKDIKKIKTESQLKNMF
jgi:hypothetical protein